MAIVIEPLTSHHDRAAFSCGIEALDRYFRTQVTQDIRRRVAACYVAVDQTIGTVAGFYTLSAGAVRLDDLPVHLAKRLPRYPSVPVAWLGRLAIARSFQGQKLGPGLLGDAARRAIRSELMAYALVVDAKDDATASFYRHHGFEHLGAKPRQLILPLASVKAVTDSR